MISARKKYAMDLLNKIPDYKLDYIIAYLQGAVIPDEILNADTVAAMEEIEEMSKNPSAYKSYSDVDKMMEEILNS